MATARHEQIEKTVIVIVRPGTPIGAAFIIGRTSAQNPCEGAVAVIMVQVITRAICRRDEQVKESVIVVVTPRATSKVVRIGGYASNLQRSSFCKRTIPIVVVQ